MLRTFSKYCLMLVVLHATGISAPAQEAVPTAPVILSAPDFINTLQQREWVSLNANGELEGKVNALNTDGELQSLADVSVALMLDGKEIAKAITDKDGAFAFAGVAPGTYALVAKSENAFSTYALHVLATGASLQTSLTVYAANIGEAKTRELVEANWVPEESAQSYYRNHQEDPLAESRKFNDSHRIRLQNGNLVGRVSRPGWGYSEQDLSGTVAHVLKNGEVVGTSSVKSDGFFTIAGLEPGVYDLFVGGEDGIAVVGFQAVAGTEGVAQKDVEGSVLVSAQTGYSDTLCCEMVQPVDIAPPVMQQEIVMDDPGVIIGEPVMGGGFAAPGGGFGGGMGGGGMGGGGLGGGGGAGIGGAGIGGLLGIAGLAVGVAALGNNDNFDPQNASIVVP